MHDFTMFQTLLEDVTTIPEKWEKIANSINKMNDIAEEQHYIHSILSLNLKKDKIFFNIVSDWKTNHLKDIYSPLGEELYNRILSEMNKETMKEMKLLSNVMACTSRMPGIYPIT